MEKLFSFLQTEILDETIRYIDSLHDQLLATIKTKGLPTSLRQSLEAHKGKIIRTPSKVLSGYLLVFTYPFTSFLRPYHFLIPISK